MVLRAWRERPSTYVVCAEDRATLPEALTSVLSATCSRSKSLPPQRSCAQLPVVDVQLAHLDGLGELEQVVWILLQMRHAPNVAVRRFHRVPVRDGGELCDVANYLPELLHAEAARLLLDLEDTVLVVVPEVLVRKLLAGSSEPGPCDKRSPLRSGR